MGVPAGRGAIGPLHTPQVAEAVELLKEAAAWADAVGSPIWTAEEIGEAVLLDGLQRVELFGLISDDRLLGCMLLQEADPIHWPESGPGEALYIHKLATRRSLRGRGLGERLVRFACELASSQAVPAVRLDTKPATGLETYYGRLGFIADPTGPATYNGRWLIRMEKRLQSGGAPATVQRASCSPRGVGTRICRA
jgi:predicted N-acetyltransferase YhbS